MDVAGAAALVCGGASGLGRATATALRDAGAEVVIGDLPGTGEGLAGSGCAFAPLDVRDPDAVAAAVALAGERAPLRVVVNCAGIGAPGRVLDRTGAPLDLERFVATIEVNLIGTFNVIRLGAAAMAGIDPVAADPLTGASPGRGVIVNTASIAAFDGQIGQAAYAASKGGIVGMTLPIARDLASRGIRCMTIAPGIFDTPLLGTLSEEVRRSLGESVPHPARLGTPAEFAALVAHVVANDMLNGEVIRLDGAIRMAPR